MKWLLNKIKDIEDNREEDTGYENIYEIESKDYGELAGDYAGYDLGINLKEDTECECIRIHGEMNCNECKYSFIALSHVRQERGIVCPGSLKCYIFDYHEFLHTVVHEDSESIVLLGKCQKSIGRNIKFNDAFSKLKSRILNLFKERYKNESECNTEDGITIINHAISYDKVLSILSERIKLIAGECLNNYCIYPDEWEKDYSGYLKESKDSNKIKGNKDPKFSIKKIIDEMNKPKEKPKKKEKNKREDVSLFTKKDEEMEYDKDFDKWQRSSED